MAGDPARQFPWCTILLVACAMTCQVCVLIGNYKTATVMNELGTSTGGWSRVGVGVARSLQGELDATMHNVSTMLLDGIHHVTFVQESLDGFLSLVGNTTDEAIKNSTELSLLQQHGPRGLSLLQQGTADGNATGNATGDATQVLASLTPLVMSSVHNVLQAVMEKVSDTLALLLEKIKPALEKVGEWIVKFGDKIQAGIQFFSATLDKVQKLFDQVMSHLHGKGGNEDDMLNQTFALFDVDNDGFVQMQDLRDVADLFSMPALQGDLPEKLMKKYDSNGNMRLNKEEMLKFVSDPAIPNSMSVMLRTYAKRLAEVAGNVAAARQRDEVAHAVVQYFQLVVAKNMTKVGWVADRLGNRSLSEEFTADILIQLCLSENDPNNLATSSIGKTVVGEMYRLHPRNTLEALDMLSNTSFWDSEGFDVQDQPGCVKRVSGWVTGAATLLQEGASSNSSGTAPGTPSLAQLAALFGSSHDQAGSDHRTLEAMPEAAGRLAEESVAIFLLDKQHREQQRQRSLFHSSTHQMLLSHLTGGVSVRAATKGPSSLEQVARAGQMARPETLQFAQWLANNASATAKERQRMCFDYSSDSSSAMDSYATQLQGMVSHIQGFIDMMTQYATPSGIEKLESTIQEFAEKGMNDVIKVVEKKMVKLLNSSAPELERAIRNAAHEAGEKLGAQVGEALGTPLGKAMVPTIKTLVGEVTNSTGPGQDVLGEELGKELANAVANLTSKALAKKAGDLVEDLVDKALVGGGGFAEDMLKEINDKLSATSLVQSIDGLYHSSHTSRRLRDQVEAFRGDDVHQILSALQTGADHADQQGDIGETLTGAWHGIIDLLRSLVNTLPTAISTLKYARREVSKLSSNLDSVFETFEDKGPLMFDSIASSYRDIWRTYFICMVPLNLAILYYAFWAGGYFGGPQPIPDDEGSGVQPPRNLRDRCSLCFSCCCVGLQKYHDTALCFWSAVIFMQVLVLIVFLASIALCVLAGVKAFVLAGCGEIYVLADNTICSETLENLRSFLDTFFVTSQAIPLSEVCEADSLLTCGLIQQKMASSSMLTTIFSFLAALFSMQLIIDSAMLHEQARWRRLAHALYLKEAAGDAAGGAVAAAPASSGAVS